MVDDLDYLDDFEVREICALSLFDCDGNTPKRFEKCKICDGKKESCDNGGYIPIMKEFYK